MRARLVPLLDAVRADLGPQCAAAAERDAHTDFVKEYILVSGYSTEHSCRMPNCSAGPHGALDWMHGTLMPTDIGIWTGI